MVRLIEDPIDHQDIVASVHSRHAGAVVTFDGTVRDHARGRTVTHLAYEAYSDMASSEMARIRREAIERWPLRGVGVVHRIGRMEIGESSVFIAVSSDHRKDAFEACRYIIDTIKTRVPIWKKEYYADGECWIEGHSHESSSTDH